ncbi:hypothetical protein CCR94_05775 [Rhodoblastus sphagnicola]|uniref:Uncharacterized protein n=1 Tax=Rhodoblastus sphagnicola TaxID=333368 RepID=A0A2S6NCI4_9HYPH|nr:hypothetical protein [Rhodoblastus sphagnicola]MBB4199339.1 hypothetical protein [Rhodoblastus sphagnicola]PPQ32317.1 hypothetical protein CCR94_05775 [Rhodoblastus sphagnicola]
MEDIINRIESIHRALRSAPRQEQRDELAAESLALCLRDLHAIVAQSRAAGRARRPSLRLIDCQGVTEPPVSRQREGLRSLTQDHAVETPS